MWPFGKSIAQRIKEALEALPVTKGVPLEISEQRGEVTIRGEVPNERFRPLIEGVASGIKGVKEVNLDLQYATTVDTKQEGMVIEPEEVEAAIASSVLAKSALRAIENNGELADDPIDVLQSSSVVILRGAVDSEHERNLAVQLAEGVAGVTGVNADELKIVGGAKAKFQEEAAKAAPAVVKTAAYVNIPDEWYVVQAGDSLSAIAEKFYGDPGKYKEIARANNIANPDLIQAGQKLQIPR